MPDAPTTLVWFKHDLRLADNPALHAAAERGAVVPVFLWTPDEEGQWAPGGAHRWWLHHSLQSLDADLRDRGLRLLLRREPSERTLRDLLDATGADAVYWNRRYEPNLLTRDDAILQSLRDDDINAKTFEGQLLHDPDDVQTTSGGPYHVYTPFWKKLMKRGLDVGTPLPAPAIGPEHAPPDWPDSLALDDLALLPEARDGVDWADGLRATWTPGESAAHERLQYALDHVIATYETDRDRPDRDGTSRLSPRLHHGELSPRQVWTAVSDWADENDAHEEAEPFLQELVWREFSYHMLHHYPSTPTQNYKDKFDGFSWEDNDDWLDRWQRGQTGYPIVDAGMRQLYETGWMHNRVRMIVGSFLTKDLMIGWWHGAEWFWDTLVDGNLASNTMGWQWSAGSGADAQPFFRIFNPTSQGERHDPNGDYVRRWVPELADLPTEHLHAPWTAPDEVLQDAGVTLGDTYPEPIVDHSEMRDVALDAYDEVR
jgi:deoxyribodipyrimidine photo-lyase